MYVRRMYVYTYVLRSYVRSIRRTLPCCLLHCPREDLHIHTSYSSQVPERSLGGRTENWGSFGVVISWQVAVYSSKARLIRMSQTTNLS